MAVLRLKEIMRDKGLSREQLASAVDVSITTISNISTEKNLPSLSLLIAIAEFMDVDIREMFVPTKESNVTIEELNEAKFLIEKGLSLLK
ncbi:MAG: helix-turn-helix transcriptional regulator [Crocinitomicaceae bacterium]